MAQYQVQYKKASLGGTILEARRFESFSEAHYAADSMRRCGYTEIAVTVVHSTKATRQYVALAVSADRMLSGRQGYRVLDVSEPGEENDTFRGRLASEQHGYGYAFVVTLSVAKRSYKKAWKAWEQAEKARQERTERQWTQQFYGEAYAHMQELGKNGDRPADWNECS